MSCGGVDSCRAFVLVLNWRESVRWTATRLRPFGRREPTRFEKKLLRAAVPQEAAVVKSSKLARSNSGRRRGRRSALDLWFGEQPLALMFFASVPLYY